MCNPGCLLFTNINYFHTLAPHCMVSSIVVVNPATTSYITIIHLLECILTVFGMYLSPYKALCIIVHDLLKLIHVKACNIAIINNVVVRCALSKMYVSPG